MLDTLTKYWVQIYAVITLLMLGANWALAKTYSKKDNVERLDKRITKLETDVKQLPTKESVHELDKQLLRVSGQLDAIAPQLRSVQRMTEMLTENELKGDK
ncbi:MAG: DUF2730 family protein [Psychromonas sp.]